MTEPIQDMAEALRGTIELSPAPPDPDEAEVDYDRQFNVEIVVQPWRGSWHTEPENATILFTRTVRINGHVMVFESDPPPKNLKEGRTYDINQGEATIEAGPFMLISLRRLTKESFDALEVTADDWMEQTTKDKLVLPVSSLTVRVAEGDEYMEHQPSY